MKVKVLSLLDQHSWWQAQQMRPKFITKMATN